jgi:MFS family permease
VFSVSAYPCGILADHIDRRWQLAAGLAVLIAADLTLVTAQNFWLTALGARFWGLQMGLIQGLLSAAGTDAAPSGLRGTGFAIYGVAVRSATLTPASAPVRSGSSGAPPRPSSPPRSLPVPPVRAAAAASAESALAGSAGLPGTAVTLRLGEPPAARLPA